MQQPQTPDSRDPDFEVLEAIRAGDPGEFDTLVERHQTRVYRLCCRLLGDLDAAQDAAQEAFVKAWKALPRFQGNSRFSTWLTRIAINQCRNELRKRGTVKHTRPLSLDDRVPGTDVSRVDTLEGASTRPYERLRGGEVRDAFLVAVSRLDAESRAVLMLKEVEALSYEGMAEVLGVPTGTIRSRLHRARAEVRRHMAGVLDPSATE